jgi:hypothetical protein
MSANRKNQYYHDVVLHHRVLKLLLSHSKTPVSQNHWLAFMAGIATTLTRVELVNDPILDGFPFYYRQFLRCWIRRALLLVLRPAAVAAVGQVRRR